MRDVSGPAARARGSSPASRANLLIDARTSDAQAIRIVTAFNRWTQQLESDPAAYAAMRKRWGHANAVPSEDVFGPDAAGGFVVGAERDYPWFLLGPRRRGKHPGEPWRDAHRIPVHWTYEHANSIPHDWTTDDT